MVRNIPTNFGKEQLQMEFAETYLKTHDSPELPFDKTKKGNLGYAFIQFWHPLFFVDFFHKHNNKSWQKTITNSTKEIQFSYGIKEKKCKKNLDTIEETMGASLSEILKRYDIATTLEDFKRKREAQCMHQKHKSSDATF